jgi:hypothetical protein
VLGSAILSFFPQDAFALEAAQAGAVAEAAEWLAGLAAPDALAVEAPAELRAAVVAALVALRAEARVLAVEVAAAQPAPPAGSIVAAQLGPVLSAESMDG